MEIVIPRGSLVVLIGPSGSGKTTFARRHFQPSQVVSSDECRRLVCDDPNNQAASADAFQVLHLIVAKRLAHRHTTVVDATNLKAKARRELLDLAAGAGASAVAIVFDVPEEVCAQRDRARPDRQVGPEVIRRQSSELVLALRSLPAEGFQAIHILRHPEQTEGAQVAVSG